MEPTQNTNDPRALLLNLSMTETNKNTYEQIYTVCQQKVLQLAKNKLTHMCRSQDRAKISDVLILEKNGSFSINILFKKWPNTPSFSSSIESQEEREIIKIFRIYATLIRKEPAIHISQPSSFCSLFACTIL